MLVRKLNSVHIEVENVLFLLHVDIYSILQWLLK